MGPPSYMLSIVDRKIVMQCIPVLLMVPTGLLHHHNCNNCKIQHENIVWSLRLMYLRVPQFVLWKSNHQGNDESWCLLNPSVVSRPSTCRCVCVCVCVKVACHHCQDVLVVAFDILVCLFHRLTPFVHPRSGGTWLFLLIIHVRVCQHQSCHC